MNALRLRIWLSGWMGAMLLLVGLAVFLIRLQHPGPYAVPAGGNGVAGVLAILLGAALLSPLARSRKAIGQINWLILLGSPAVLFFSLYATLAELEEVVIVEARDQTDAIAHLRLWVVDFDDGVWVTMPASKAEYHRLGATSVTLMRNGRRTCVVATRSNNRAQINKIHHLRHEKYLVQRLATSIGLFSADAAPTTITLRLDPCIPA